jgi:hypothetical protein
MGPACPVSAKLTGDDKATLQVAKNAAAETPEKPATPNPASPP